MLHGLNNVRPYLALVNGCWGAGEGALAITLSSCYSEMISENALKCHLCHTKRKWGLRQFELSLGELTNLRISARGLLLLLPLPLPLLPLPRLKLCWQGCSLYFKGSWCWGAHHLQRWWIITNSTMLRNNQSLQSCSLWTKSKFVRAEICQCQQQLNWHQLQIRFSPNFAGKYISHN